MNRSERGGYQQSDQGHPSSDLLDGDEFGESVSGGLRLVSVAREERLRTFRNYPRGE